MHLICTCVLSSLAVAFSDGGEKDFDGNTTKN